MEDNVLDQRSYRLAGKCSIAGSVKGFLQGTDLLAVNLGQVRMQTPRRCRRSDQLGSQACLPRLQFI